DPVHVGDAQDENAAAGTDDQALEILVARAQLAEQRIEPVVDLDPAPAAQMHAGALDRFAETVRIERLEHVVDGVRIERTERELVIRGREDGDRHVRGAERLEDTETVQPRHLNIEEEQVGTYGLDQRHSLLAAPRLADDVDVGLRLEMKAHALTCE